MKYPAELKCW